MPANSQADRSGPSPSALKEAFRTFMADPAVDIPEATNPVQELLDEHFGESSLELPTAQTAYNFYLEVCFQRAIDEFLGEDGRSHKITGLRCPSVPDYRMGQMSFARLLSPPTFAFVPPVFCPVDYGVVPSGCEQTQACLRQGLVLFHDADGPGALWLRHDQWNMKIVIEIMATSMVRAEAILAQLREASIRLSPFTGQVLEIFQTPFGPVIKFLDRPRDTKRDEVILPEGMLKQIERHSLGVINARESLETNGRHKKRGLLLHGKPGTGKTHTIKYLISQMPDATIAVMSAARMREHLGVIRQVIDVIVPGVIVLDDVDLIAEDRAMAGSRNALFQLLDILDGIGEDKDLLFVMTTNRPNEIEPAIAARPGRVDQAIQVPLPDAGCRRRLFELYSRGLDVQMTEEQIDAFNDRIDGVTASFIREVLRRATVAALDFDGDTTPIVVSHERVTAALDELLDPENPLTPLLLGAEPKHAIPTVTVAATRQS